MPPASICSVNILGSHTGSSPSSVISIPHRIHQMAANHLNITNSVLYSYEYWEVADTLAKENKGEFWCSCLEKLIGTHLNSLEQNMYLILFCFLVSSVFIYL